MAVAGRLILDLQRVASVKIVLGMVNVLVELNLLHVIIVMVQKNADIAKGTALSFLRVIMLHVAGVKEKNHVEKINAHIVMVQANAQRVEEVERRELKSADLNSR